MAGNTFSPFSYRVVDVVKRVIPIKLTRFKGKTRMTRINEEALRVIRSIKGSFG